MFEEVRKAYEYDAQKQAIKQLLKILNDLDNGLVTVMIKEGKIKRIEKNEKLRLR